MTHPQSSRFARLNRRRDRRHGALGRSRSLGRSDVLVDPRSAPLRGASHRRLPRAGRGSLGVSWCCPHAAGSGHLAPLGRLRRANTSGPTGGCGQGPSADREGPWQVQPGWSTARRLRSPRVLGVDGGQWHSSRPLALERRTLQGLAVVDQGARRPRRAPRARGPPNALWRGRRAPARAAGREDVPRSEPPLAMLRRPRAIDR